MQYHFYFAGGDKPKSKATAPVFKEKPKVGQDASGKNIVIECRCTGSPKPTITWFKGTQVVASSTRVKQTMTESGGEYIIKMEIVVSDSRTQIIY